MFHTFVTLFIALAVIVGVVPTPAAAAPANDLVARGGVSLNNWGGFTSLKNFDNFYGADNFDGSRYNQVLVKKDLVCHTQQVEVVQQRLLVLQEMAKRIITEQICETEVQTIVFQQYFSGLHGFSRDLRRISGHQVGFDEHIAGHHNRIINHDGSLNTDDWGFSGHDLGNSVVVVRGNNWRDKVSFKSVRDAFTVSRNAVRSLHGKFFD